MAIIKLKTRENPYVQIDKTGINDSNLSWKATGLLTYLVGRPADWKIILEQLANVKTDGISACKSALRELRSFNYCHYFELRQQGKVVETFYIVYEVPTPYSNELHNNILNDIEGIDETYSLVYKKVEKDQEPKAENLLSVKTPINSKLSPKVENPLAVKPLADNNRLLIIDDTKERENNNRNHDHDNELDFFEKLFKEFGINFTTTNKESVLRLRKSLSLKDVELYLRETYQAIKENKDVVNVPALFSSKIAKGERQINSKPKEKNKENIKTIKLEEIKLEEIEEETIKDTNTNNKIEKNDEIEKINEMEQQAINESLEIYSNLTTEEQNKIEEQAIELLCKCENLEKGFILGAKKTSPNIYTGMVRKYIHECINQL